jgi:hypothetical protein
VTRPCSDESGCGFTPPRTPDSAQHCRAVPALAEAPPTSSAAYHMAVAGQPITSRDASAGPGPRLAGPGSRAGTGDGRGDRPGSGASRLATVEASPEGRCRRAVAGVSVLAAWFLALRRVLDGVRATGAPDGGDGSLPPGAARASPSARSLRDGTGGGSSPKHRRSRVRLPGCPFPGSRWGFYGERERPGARYMTTRPRAARSRALGVISPSAGRSLPRRVTSPISNSLSQVCTVELTSS